MLDSFNKDFIEITLITASVIVAGIYWARYLGAENGIMRSIFKTTPVVLMALAAILVSGPWLLVVALLLSALGDYFLSLDDQWFLPGLGAFLGGHIAYIVLFLGHVEPAASLPAVGVIIYTAVFGTYLWRRAGKYRWPVMAYITVIAVMAMSSLMLQGAVLITLGAFVFVLSDSILALRMFVFGNNRVLVQQLTVAVWVTYILGQILILHGALSLP